MKTVVLHLSYREQAVLMRAIYALRNDVELSPPHIRFCSPREVAQLGDKLADAGVVDPDIDRCA